MRTSGPLNTRDNDGYETSYSRGQHSGGGYANTSSIVENFELENELGRGGVNRPLLSDTQRSSGGCPKLSLKHLPIIILGFLFIVMIITCFGMFFFNSCPDVLHLERTGSNDISNNTALLEYNVPCLSGLCTDIAGSSLSQMFTYTDKCEKYYLHMCGGFIERSRYPEDEFEWDMFSEVEEHLENVLINSHRNVDNVTTFDDLENQVYLRCATDDDASFRSEGEVQNLLEKTAEMLFWDEADIEKFNDDNVTTDDARHDAFQNLLIQMDALGVPFFVNFKAHFDFTVKDAVGQMIIAVPDDLFYLIKDSDMDLRNHLYAFDSLAPSNKTLGSVETRLSSLKKLLVTLRNALGSETPIELSWEDAKTTINIPMFFDKSVLASQLKLDGATMIYMQHHNFFDQYFGKVKFSGDGAISMQALIDLARMTFLFKYRLELPNYVERHLAARENVSTTKHRDKRCLHQFELVLVERLHDYTKREQEREYLRVLEIADEMRLLMVNRVDTYDWMDEPTKLAAKDKLKSIDFHIGYTTSGSAEIDRLYSNRYGALSDYVDKLFLEQVKQKYLASERYELKAIGERWSDVSKWHFSFNFVLPEYLEKTNTVVIPIGLLNHKFLHHVRANDIVEDTVASIAATSTLGFLIASKIVHSIDNIGNKYDKDGTMVEWMSAESLKRLTEAEQCVAKQYNSYSVTVEELTGGSLNKSTVYLNGKLEATENLASAAGLSAAYEHHIANLKNDTSFKPLPGLDVDYKRLFYIFAAQLHCGRYNVEALIRASHLHIPVGKWRVMGPLEDFSNAAADLECPEFKFYNCSIF